MHKFSSRSDESADLGALRHARGAPACGSAPANVLLSTLRRPTERNTAGAQRTPDDFVSAVENLCIVRAMVSRPMNTMTFVASATASSSRSNDDAMSVTSWRRSDKEIDAVPPPPFGLMGVAGDLGAPACGSRNTGGAQSTPDGFAAAVENLCISPATSLISPGKPHQQTSSYLWNETRRFA